MVLHKRLFPVRDVRVDVRLARRFQYVTDLVLYKGSFLSVMYRVQGNVRLVFVIVIVIVFVILFILRLVFHRDGAAQEALSSP